MVLTSFLMAFRRCVIWRQAISQRKLTVAGASRPCEMTVKHGRDDRVTGDSSLTARVKRRFRTCPGLLRPLETVNQCSLGHFPEWSCRQALSPSREIAHVSLARREFAGYPVLLMVGLAQLVRASDCGSEGRGFEPRISPFTRLIRKHCE